MKITKSKKKSRKSCSKVKILSIEEARRRLKEQKKLDNGVRRFYLCTKCTTKIQKIYHLTSQGRNGKS